MLADDFAEMERQALEISSWGDNVFVKIPVTNTKRETCHTLIKRLSGAQVKLNVTAVMTLAQVQEIMSALNPATAAYVSVFAGRIADTGRDPLPMMAKAVDILKPNPNVQLMWASSRELLNIFQADAIGCHVITVTKDVLSKIPFIGYDLADYSVDTVKMFYDDARSSDDPGSRARSFRVDFLAGKPAFENRENPGHRIAKNADLFSLVKSSGFIRNMDFHWHETRQHQLSQ